MNILLLGPSRPHIARFIESYSDKVISVESPITLEEARRAGAEFIVSYGYRHIIRQDVIDYFAGRAINLHISLLPWNRGADPNLWSFLEDTPKGVSIHLIDAGLDTGDIIAQQKVDYYDGDTLASTYNRLSTVIEKLLYNIWPDIREGLIKSRKQPSGGSYHLAKDRARYEHLLVNGWDTPVKTLIGQARK
jgi:methionyl-tRNA formyltransferase